MTDLKEMANEWKKLVPTVSFNKNGYEIRSNVLEMAKHQVWQDYEATVGMVGMKVKKEGDEVVTVITMPDVPGTEKILETAQAFYDFVNNSKPKA